MRASEFIIEGITQGKITKRQQESTRGLHRYYDAEAANTDYTHYRIMMACAATDGKIKPDMDGKSWHGKMKTAHPYTQEEVDMLKIAYDIAGANWEDMNHGDLESCEVKAAINTKSPVPQRKKNRYGV